MNYLRFTQAFILYLLLFSVRAVLVIMGLFVVPIAFYCRTGHRFPKWAWLWGNDEDGIFGPEWFHRGAYNARTCFRWCAIRNPVNNLRFVDFFNVTHSEGIKAIIIGDTINPDPITSREFGRAVWHLTLVRQKGFYYFGFWYVKAFFHRRHFRMRFGWKCPPDWIDGPPSKIHDDAGITFQFLPYRKG